MRGSSKVDQRPSFQFYPDDWLAESSLSLCSLQTQGAWIRLLCHMFKSPERGVLLDAKGMQIDANGICKLLATDHANAMQIIAELTQTGACETRSDGALYCRRMVRESADAQCISDARRHAANMRWTHAKHAPSASSPASTPTSKNPPSGEKPTASRPPRKLEDSTSPTHQFLGFFAEEFKRRTGEECPDMDFGKNGALAKKLLAKYPLEKLKALVVTMWESEDAFIRGAGKTVGLFASQLPKLLSGARPVDPLKALVARIERAGTGGA